MKKVFLMFVFAGMFAVAASAQTEPTASNSGKTEKKEHCTSDKSACCAKMASAKACCAKDSKSASATKSEKSDKKVAVNNRRK